MKFSRMKTLLAAGASLAAVTLALPAVAQDAPDEATHVADPQMSFGTWGFDPATRDSAVDPGDDFAEYANGGWEKANALPADKSRFNSFDFLQEEAIEDIEELIAEFEASDPAPGSAGRRIIDAYHAYLDTDAIDASGLTPAYPFLTNIYGANDLAELVALFPKAGYPSLVSAGVSVDVKAPTTRIVSLGFDGMGLGERDYYLVDNERNLEIRSKYLDLLEYLLKEAGYADPANAARAVYAFEKKVAELEWDRQVLRNPDLTYNILSRDELLALQPEFPLLQLLEGSGFAGEDRFLVRQLPPTDEELEAAGLADADPLLIGGGLPAMMELLEDTPLATLKAYMAAHFLDSNASVLSSELDEKVFAFYGTAINGAPAQRPREKRAVAVVQGMLGEQLGQLYVQRHFPPEAKAQMLELVGNLKKAFKQGFEQSTWMTPETTAEALKKLETIEPMIGYPEKFETYEGMAISATDPLGNKMSAIEWAIAKSLAELHDPVDRTEWGLLPQTVNAYYSPVTNQVVFPAAVLQPPFFDPDADPAVNYGAIGAGIGHEIGHGFDDKGSMFDASGALRNWWQEADREAFDKMGDRMVALIESYCPLDDGKLCLKGRQSLGEVLGDTIGLQTAYRAYRMSLNGEEAPVLDGLTGDQRFFLAFAQIWRGLKRPEYQRMLVMSDGHPPDEFRINNTVRQMDTWYEAFGVTEDDALYLPPEMRIHIW